MDRALLATKLRVPPQAHHVVHRGRLVDDLERGLPFYKLVLISAPAGFGKTTLLAQWARTSQSPVAWLSLGEDDDADRFLRYLVASWEAIQPDVGDSPLAALVGAAAVDRDAVLAAFLDAANAVSDHTAFVLDDYHLVGDPSVHAALTFLLDRLPSTLHVVLAGRAEPPLPLARYRARQELLEVRAEELSFTVDETGEFLNQQVGLELPHNELVTLHAQLEGWIAGLQLAALTLQRRPSKASGPVVSGRHRFIADYLSEEVLAHLPDDSRRFLLRTSILDRLCGPLCDAVTGRDDGQEKLEQLERANLFLVPLDDVRAWFRYHQVFADFLRDELHRRHLDEVADLHRRTAAWYLAHDLPDPAFRHAVAGDDPGIGVRIFDRYVNAKLQAGEFSTVQRWLDALPAPWCSAYPVFDLARAGLLASTGALDACIRCIDDVERRLAHAQGDDRRQQLARVAAVRCAIACLHNDVVRAEALADQALRELPSDDLGFRLMIHGALGDTYRRNGRWEEARACYLRVLDLPHAPTVHVQSAHVFGALADLELRRGRLRAAGGYWRKALAAIQDRENWGAFPLPLIGWVFIRMGELLYEWNDLAAARDHVSRGVQRAELGGDVRALIAGHVVTARLNLADGDLAAAAAALDRARPLTENTPLREWAARFDRCQLELWLAQGKHRAAGEWVDAMLRSGMLEASPDNAITHLALARALIVNGDAPSRDRALALLDRLVGAALAEGQADIRIEALALGALARWQGGDRARAMTALEGALRLAEPEGYVRLFADLGLPMARLLQEARSRGVMPDYVAALLAACGVDRAAFPPERGALPEPLSRREQDVLGLLAAGLTNREIAETLAISPETVKKHAVSIYGKLGVRGRRAAAAKARELALLG